MRANVRAQPALDGDQMAMNSDKLNEFLGKAIVDFGATFHAALIGIGDKLGLYKALAASGHQTPAELAKPTNTSERYVREWLCSQAAVGYVSYDAASGKFYLSEEQAFALPTTTARRFCLARSRWRWAQFRQKTSSKNGSRPGREWAGTSTMQSCSWARSAFSGPVTRPT
jgi:hypothetical protein